MLLLVISADEDPGLRIENFAIITENTWCMCSLKPLLVYRFKVPEFRNFKAVPIRDKDLPDNVFQVFTLF